MLNPLLDAIFIAISDKQQHKIHSLAATLNGENKLPQLDSNPSKNLFKRNFMIMNALFQLQDDLLKDGLALTVSSMHIQLQETANDMLSIDNPLRDYYLDWQNYDTSEDEIQALLDSFWCIYTKNAPAEQVSEAQIKHICQRWQLSYPYCAQQLKKQWRHQALAQHPDKLGGCAARFVQLKQDYELLKAHLFAIS